MDVEEYAEQSGRSNLLEKIEISKDLRKEARGAVLLLLSGAQATFVFVVTQGWRSPISLVAAALILAWTGAALYIVCRVLRFAAFPSAYNEPSHILDAGATGLNLQQILGYEAKNIQSAIDRALEHNRARTAALTRAYTVAVIATGAAAAIVAGWLFMWRL